MGINEKWRQGPLLRQLGDLLLVEQAAIIVDLEMIITQCTLVLVLFAAVISNSSCGVSVWLHASLR